MDKFYKVLEFDKIIEQVKEFLRLNKNKVLIDETVLTNDFDLVSIMLDEVEEASIIIKRVGEPPIFFSDDVEKNINYASKNGLLSEKDVYEIGRFLDCIKENQIFVEKTINIVGKIDHYKKYVDLLIYPKDLNMSIKKIIDDNGNIKDDASPVLNDIRRNIRLSEANIQKKLKELISKLASKLTQNIISIRNNRYVLSVKNDYKNSVPGIIHDQSGSGETVYIEPSSVCEISNRLNQLLEEEKREIVKILQRISSNIADNYEDLNFSFNIFLSLDLICAKAKYSIKINGNKPNINNSGKVSLINCYHPLLNVPNIVKNTITIGNEYKGIIITGPNTGGKTVLLKTVGLLSLMVKFGLMLPCDERSNLNIFDNVYSDIGDEQSIAQNLSTFSSHLKNIIEIIEKVTKNSLVLFDELGAGTDPLEGASLAISIIEYVLNKECMLIATSHYSDLKVYAFNNSNLINASVEFDSFTLKPTYKLLLGIPGQSNAIEISKNLGLKTEVIEKAKEYAFQKNDQLNSILDKLIKQAHEMDEKLKNIEKLELETKIKKEKTDELYDNTIIEREKILKKANVDSQKLIEEKISEAKDILKELKKLKTKEVKLHEIANLQGKINIVEEENIESDLTESVEEFEINDMVFVKNYNSSGKIIEKKKDKFLVSIGNATMLLEKNEIKKIAGNYENTVTNKKIEVAIPKKISTNLDLRGKRYEEASILIDKFLDDALLAALGQVSIIHGFGTGTMRKLVLDKLSTNKHIKEYRYGRDGEGGQGVTIIYFK
ncbi:MAG: endonuclease MutS2 [Bacilli bacterium]